MKTTLNYLLELNTLSREQARQLMLDIGTGTLNNAHVASLLTVLLMRPVALEELHGFKDGLLELCVPFKVDHPAIDLCGTGGDGKNTFNISTLASFVVAGAGYKVAKHGNYGVSSTSGSSNVMEYFGYRFTNDASTLKKQFDRSGICFLHAPLFHPALKHVAGVRKQIGVRTFFNMLGPLVNPAQPKYRLTGVYNLELGRLYHYLMQQGELQYKVVHSLGGYDEISLTSLIKCFGQDGETILEPENLGFEYVTEDELWGGATVEDAARIFIAVLEGEGNVTQNNVVLANAAMAIQCMEPNKTFDECRYLATESLNKKLALQTFRNLVA